MKVTSVSLSGVEPTIGQLYNITLSASDAEKQNGMFSCTVTVGETIASTLTIGQDYSVNVA